MHLRIRNATVSMETSHAKLHRINLPFRPTRERFSSLYLFDRGRTFTCVDPGHSWVAIG